MEGGAGNANRKEFRSMNNEYVCVCVCIHIYMYMCVGVYQTMEGGAGMLIGKDIGV